MSSHFLYFAYGSNMLTERLVDRCSSAKAVSTALINGYRIEFSKRSKDESGKATLVRENNSIVHGILYKINYRDLKSLDAAEGAGYGYERITIEVRAGKDNDLIDAYSYIATKTDSTLRPYSWYKALVLAGASQHGLPKDYQLKISKCEAIHDEKLERDSRLKAITVLQRAGFKNLIE